MKYFTVFNSETGEFEVTTIEAIEPSQEYEIADNKLYPLDNEESGNNE